MSVCVCVNFTILFLVCFGSILIKNLLLKKNFYFCREKYKCYAKKFSNR